MSALLPMPIGERDRHASSRRIRKEAVGEGHDGEPDVVSDDFRAIRALSEASQGSTLFGIDSAARARIVTGLQQTRGNAYVQRVVAGPLAVSQDYDELAQRIQTANSRGGSLDPDLRARLEVGLGADLTGVRVHTDAEADRLARAFDAAAFTTGQDIFFRAREHNPRSPEGLRLLAHEAAHAVQQGPGRSRLGQRSLRLSQPADASEREAEAVASEVVAGQRASVSAAPGAPIARGIWDSIKGSVSDAWDWTKNKASDVGSAVGDAASTAWDWTKAAGSTIYGGMKKGAGYVKQGEQWLGHGIDWLQGKASGGAHWLANKAEGIPVLEQVANAGAWAVDKGTQFAGGVLKGATGLLGGVAGMVVNPVDTAIGLGKLAEHLPIGMPGMPNPLKMARGLYDVAFNDKDIGEVTNRVLNPIESMKEDAAFWGTVGRGIIKPYEEAIDKGKWAEAAGRGVFDIGTLLLGGGGAAAKGAGTASRVASVAGKTAEVTRGLEGAAVASEAARGMEAAAVASEAARAAKGAEVAGGAARAAEGAEVAGGAARAAEGAQAAKGAGAAFAEGEIDDLLRGIDKGKAESQSFFQLPGQNPQTGEGLQKIKIKADETKDIAYHQNMTFKGVEGAPTPKVEVRYHSANPNAPQGSYSGLNPTTQINTVPPKGVPKEYMLPDGTWKRLEDMTEAERAAAHFP